MGERGPRLSHLLFFETVLTDSAIKPYDGSSLTEGLLQQPVTPRVLKNSQPRSGKREDNRQRCSSVLEDKIREQRDSIVQRNDVRSSERLANAA